MIPVSSQAAVQGSGSQQRGSEASATEGLKGAWDQRMDEKFRGREWGHGISECSHSGPFSETGSVDVQWGLET